MIQKPYQIEACVGSFAEAKLAQNRGADLIELCGRLDLDGLTPSKEDVVQCLSHLTIPVKVMIRPLPTFFNADQSQLDLALQQIEEMSQLGVEHFVFGFTTGIIGRKRLHLTAIKQLAAHVPSRSITVHKAIDVCQDPIVEAEALLEIDQVTHILTSGGAETAMRGMQVIRDMNEITGTKINIIAAGSILESDIVQHHELLNLNHYHGRRIVGALS